MRHLSAWQAFVVSLIACAVAGHPSYSIAETIDDVLRAWKQREDDTKSFRFKCEVSEVINKLTLQTETPGRNQVPVLVPAQDTVLDREFIYALKEGKALYREDGQTWDPVRGEPTTRQFSMNFDGQAVRQLFVYQNDRPHGAVYLDESSKEQLGQLSMQSSVTTLTLIYRPTQFLDLTGANADALSIRQSVSPPPPDGITSVAFAAPNNPIVYYIWTDPQRNYLPVRWLRLQLGIVNYDESIEYREDRSSWLPAKWRSKLFKKSKLVGTRDTTVTDGGINLPLEDDSFKIEFPQGTEVNEYKGGTERTYFVPENGQ